MNSVRFDYSGHCLALCDNLSKSKRVREGYVLAGEEGGGGSATYPPALPKSHKGTMWEGGWSVDDCDGFPRIVLFEDGLGFSPLGETGEGFSVRIKPCP